MPILILASVTGFFFILLLLLGLYRSTSKFAIARRIDRVITSTTETSEEELNKPFTQRIILPLGEKFARLFRGYTPGSTADRIQKKLLMAGLYPQVTPSQIMGLSWFSAAACLGGVFVVLLAMAGTSDKVQYDDPFNLLLLIGGAVGGYILPQFVLSRKIRHRHEEILTTLSFAIDILSISVEAGMGFDSALGYTMRKLKGPLAEEFGRTLNEIRLGKPRLEALEDLGNRAGVEDLKIFITAVVHASRLGGSITNTLRIQADSIRVRRRQHAQEQAMKAPVKMVFPLVFFIFPALGIVILGPALISIWRQLMQ
jgi:tight adherence protein C